MKKKKSYNGYNKTFDLVVTGLDDLAKKLDPFVPGGMDYVKINVIGFCVILPLVLGSSLALNVALLLLI